MDQVTDTADGLNKPVEKVTYGQAFMIDVARNKETSEARIYLAVTDHEDHDHALLVDLPKAIAIRDGLTEAIAEAIADADGQVTEDYSYKSIKHDNPVRMLVLTKDHPRSEPHKFGLMECTVHGSLISQDDYLATADDPDTLLSQKLPKEFVPVEHDILKVVFRGSAMAMFIAASNFS